LSVTPVATRRTNVPSVLNTLMFREWANLKQVLQKKDTRVGSGTGFSRVGKTVETP
jgi:hypothetical protein